MEDERQKQEAGIPENAFRELKPGEEYIPVMRPDRQYPEVTPYSVIMGLVMAIIFSAAAAYLGLKVGQVFEAAIPIAIIAVGVSGALNLLTVNPFIDVQVGRVEEEKRPRTERDNPIYRRLVGNRGGRSHLHPPGALHPSSQVWRRHYGKFH